MSRYKGARGFKTPTKRGLRMLSSSRSVSVKLRVMSIVLLGFAGAHASIEFDAFTANMVFKATNAQSQIKNRQDITGFSNQSIIKDFGHNDLFNWLEVCANNPTISQSDGTAVFSTHMIVANSSIFNRISIQYRSFAVIQNSIDGTVWFDVW